MFKDIKHDNAVGHVQGKSEFIDDRPMMRGELIASFIGSSIAKGKIIKRDYKEALKIPGIEAVYDYRDLHHNLWGNIVEDQPILAGNDVNYVGEPIVIVVGKSFDVVEIAKKKIVIEYEKKTPQLSLASSIEKEEFLEVAQKIERGNLTDALEKSEFVIEGIFKSDGQEHFYLESQATLVYPSDMGTLEVLSSTQNPTETQHVVSRALGLDQSKVVVSVKRMGGGFGGKESQSMIFAVIASLCAYKLQKSCR